MSQETPVQTAKVRGPLDSRSFVDGVRGRLLLWSGIAVLSGAGVFVLPFAWPPGLPTFSTSYPYGFNNRVAEIAAAAMAGAVLLLLWSLRLGRAPAAELPGDRMPRWWLWSAATVPVVFTAALGSRVVQAHTYYSDASYVVWQLNRVLNDHAVLYRDVNFAYGPLFFRWAAAMQRALGSFGMGAMAAHMVTLASMQAIGVALLFFLLHELPLSRRLRGVALTLCTFGTLTPLLGLDYTLLRFLLPHAMFLAIVRLRSLAGQTALFAVAQLVALGFSPELGVAMLGGVGCYALYRGVRDGLSWLLPAAAVAAATAGFYAAMPKSYLDSIRHFSDGAFNLVVMPDFHILVLLIAGIALSPLAVAGYLAARDGRGPKLLGFFVISVALLAPALGRCDPLHTFFNGLGLYLLSLVAVDRLRTAGARVWVIALALFVVGYQVDDLRVYAPLMRRVAHPDPPGRDGVDMTRLEALTGGQRIAVPVVAPERVTDALIARGQYQPSYFVFMGGVWDDALERRKIDEVRGAPFVLIPNRGFTAPHPDFEGSLISRAFRLNYRYRIRRRPWVQGAALSQELRLHWTPVGSVGEYTVYRQNGE